MSVQSAGVLAKYGVIWWGDTCQTQMEVGGPGKADGSLPPGTVAQAQGQDLNSPWGWEPLGTFNYRVVKWTGQQPE